MLDNIKSNKTVWMVIGVAMILIIAISTTVFIQQQSKQNLAQQPQNTAVSKSTLSEEELEKIVNKIMASDPNHKQDEFAYLVEDSIVQQPIPEDAALVKDELSQLKDIQIQLQEQKDILVQQHQDADQLLKLKEEQLMALEQQLQN